MRIPGDLLLHYRQLERLHHQLLPATSFIQFLCASFWRTWVPTLGVSDKWEAIYRRDRYRCTSPVCHQRNVTLHHVQYRARGGTDSPDNLTSPCAFCHLEGEHGGRLKILPPGSNPTWVLGRRPIMRVHGRERTLLA
ncbi:MAG: HNH endonuclease [Myxococcales bacterium]|nr:MAG: HNH endonuclease [Myxococcales bacterium]